MESTVVKIVENRGLWDVKWQRWVEAVYDLQNGRYVVRGLDNQDSTYDFSINLTEDDFRPNILRRRGRR